MPKVPFEHYQGGREAAYIKHCLLEEYLPQLAIKVGSAWDSLVYVEGFAGPWEVKGQHLEDSSFAVALNAFDRAAEFLKGRYGKRPNIQAVLVEKDGGAFQQLDSFARGKNKEGMTVSALKGQFHTLVPEITRLAAMPGRNPFKFVFLDPKGWKDIPMAPISTLIKARSCEVLVNIMTKHMGRFIAEDDRAESFERLFGRADVRPILLECAAEEKDEIAVREYCKSLRSVCGYKYVSSAVIFEPDKNQIRYFLVYATNHPTGIEVFKAAESKAAKLQDSIRYQARMNKDGPSLFSGLMDDHDPRSKYVEGLRFKYCVRAQRKVLSALLNSGASPVAFRVLFCEAMAFPLVTPADLQSWLTGYGEWVSIERDGADGKSKRKLDYERNDTVRAVSVEKLEVLKANLLYN